MEAVGFLEALVRALGRGWSARYGMIAPYGVYGLTLTTDVGGVVEVVPSLVRGPAVIWSPFVFTRGRLHYDVHADAQMLLRTPTIADAVVRLERWRQARDPAGRVAARLAQVGSRPRRTSRTTEVDLEHGAPRDDQADVAARRDPRADAAARRDPQADVGARRDKLARRDDADRHDRAGRGERSTVTPLRVPVPVPPPSSESLIDVLRAGKLERARKLARQREPGLARRELLAFARAASGEARANALGVLVPIARPEDGPELARYLDDPERGVQRVAVDGVKRTRYAAAVPALAALVLGRDGKPASSKSQLAALAAAAMKALSGKRGAAALTGYLTASDPRVREAACVAFTLATQPGTKLARPLLERLLADADARVARAAKRALATL